MSNGIECELGTFNEFSYLHLLDEGWHYTPEECYAVQENDQEEIESEKKAEKKTDAPEEEVLSEKHKLRAKAKAAGIKRYWKKPIPTLEKELKELDENAEHRPES